jgi:hypothetical protein
VEKPGSAPDTVLQDTVLPDSVRQDPIVADGATEAGFPPSKGGYLTATDRWRALWDEITAPTFLLASVGPATGDHVASEPASWRGDVIGYGMRVGSNAGRQLIESGTAHGLAAAARLDLRFQPRGRGGIGSRIRCAALEAVTARTPRGSRIPNVPRVLGTYGAALAQQRWQSGEVRPGDAALATALGLGIDVAVNVVIEFAGGS